MVTLRIALMARPVCNIQAEEWNEAVLIALRYVLHKGGEQNETPESRRSFMSHSSSALQNCSLSLPKVFSFDLKCTR